MVKEGYQAGYTRKAKLILDAVSDDGKVTQAGSDMGDFVAWALFLILGPILWASGLWLYVRAEMSARRKWIWALLLAAFGLAIGLLLPLRAIRDRFLIVAAVLPLLAFIDNKLATSKRGMSFWLRACAFEVCTVFGVAGIVAGLRQ